MKKYSLLAIKNKKDHSLIAELLKSNGFNVDDFGNIDKYNIRKQCVDLIITDAFWGYKLKTQIQALKKSEKAFLPLLLLLQSTESSGKWLNLGFDDIIRVPISKQEFVLKVSNFALIREQSKTIIESSEKKYKAIFESTGTATLIVDADTKILLANKECTSVFGYNQDELIGNPWTKFAAESSLQQMLYHHNIRRIHPDNAPKKYEVQILHKDGEERDVMLDVSVIPGTGQSIVSMLDISREKITLKENKKLITAIEQNPLSVVITNKEGKIEYVNKMFTQTTEYSFSEVVGRKPRIFNPGHLSEEEYKKMWDSLNNLKSWNGEYLNRKKNGEPFWENVSISAMSTEQEGICNYVLIKEDISDKKKIQQELIKAKDKAEESNRLKTAFLANLSHEIRTPMNAILGFTGLLKEPDLSSEKRDNFISIIHKSGNYLLSVITDIVEVAKIDAKQVSVNYSEFDINNFAKEIYDSMLINFPKDKAINFYMEKSNIAEGITISTDDVKLKQIILNLITNAFKYTLKGEVVLKYNFTTDNYLEIIVTDTGIGIPEKYHEIIFERFRQVEIENRIFQQGSGLGLSICKAYAEMLGGTIRVESEPDKGSTFTVSIPVKIVKGMPDKPEPVPLTVNSLKKIKILVAEDDEINYIYIKEILPENSFTLFHAYNGKEAVKMFKEITGIGLILMDIKMPVMNGYETLKEIRKLDTEIPIIAQTAYALSEDSAKIESAGFDGYISKPIKKDQLIELIEKTMR